MNGNMTLQITVVSIVLAVIAATEWYGLALAAAPGSETLWYINREVLGSLRPGIDFLTTQTGLSGFSFIATVIALGGAIAVAAYYRQRLICAFSCNVAFVLCATFFALWHFRYQPLEVASLETIAQTTTQAPILWFMIIATIIAALVSHYDYLRAAFSNR